MKEIDKFSCDCGKTLQFMSYCIRRGLDRNLIQVGCPDCLKVFFIIADRDEVRRIPHINQSDSAKITISRRNGKWLDGVLMQKLS